MSVIGKNLFIQNETILSVCFLCCAKSFSSLLFKQTKRKQHKLYLFT